MYLQKETHILQGGFVLVRPTDYVHNHTFTYKILSLRLRVNIFNLFNNVQYRNGLLENFAILVTHDKKYFIGNRKLQYKI